jgi:hypothetical protein
LEERIKRKSLCKAVLFLVERFGVLVAATILCAVLGRPGEAVLDCSDGFLDSDISTKQFVQLLSSSFQCNE